MGNLSGAVARPGVRPVFGLLWLGGTVLGFPLGTTLGMSILYLPMAILVGAALQAYAAVRGDIGFTGDAVYFAGLALGGITGTGIVVGAAQWLILRRRVSKAGWWVIATGAGYFLGAIAGFLVHQALARVPGLPGRLAAVLTFAAAGAVVGLLQGLVLRRHVSRAVRWVAGSSVGFGLAYAVGLGIRALVAAPPSEASVAGLVSAMATLFLGPQGYLAFAATVGLITAATLVRLWEAPVWPAVRPTAAFIAAGLIIAVGYSRLGGGAAPVKSIVLTGTERVSTLAWSPDGTRLMSGDFHGPLRTWDTTTGRPETPLGEYRGPVPVSGWSPTRSRVVSGGKLWDATTGKLLRDLGRMVGHESWNRDGSLLAAMGLGDDTIRLFDGTTGDVVQVLRGHGETISSFAWAPDGLRLASVFESRREGTIDIWSIDGRELSVIQNPGVANIAWSPDGSRIASSPVTARRGQSDIRIWNARTGREERRLDAEGIRPAIAWSSNDRYLAVNDGTIHIWRVNTWASVAILRYNTSAYEMTWSPDGTRLAVLVSNTIRIWDASTHRQTYVLRGHTGYPVAVAWSPDGKRLASWGPDDTVRIWTLP